jgi:hypothetical protein
VVILEYPISIQAVTQNGGIDIFGVTSAFRQLRCKMYDEMHDGGVGVPQSRTVHSYGQLAASIGHHIAVIIFQTSIRPNETPPPNQAKHCPSRIISPRRTIICLHSPLSSPHSLHFAPLRASFLSFPSLPFEKRKTTKKKI